MSIVEKTCSCFGHSDVDITELKVRTRIEIDRAIEDGVRIFLLGGRSDFDDLCYGLVTEKRNADPQLNINSSMRRWSVRQSISIIGTQQSIIVILL